VRLKVRRRRPASLSQFVQPWFTGPPPGDPEVYTDELGRKVTRYPPGYAEGARPQGSVRPSGHIEFEDDEE
jgi:hypothetical protein